MVQRRSTRNTNRVSYAIASDSELDEKDDSDESVRFDQAEDESEDSASNDMDEDFGESRKDNGWTLPARRHPQRNRARQPQYAESSSEDSSVAMKQRRRKPPVRDVDIDDADEILPVAGQRRGLARAAKNNVVYHDDVDLEGLDEEDRRMFAEDAPKTEAAESPPRHPQPEVEVIFACKKRDDVDQFYCKMKGFSHRACGWLTEEEVVEAGGAQRLKKFLQRQGLFLPLVEEDGGVEEADEIYFDPQYTEVDRIIAEDDDLALGQNIYLVKWKGLPYDQCTWELRENLSDAQDAIQLFERRNRMRPDVRRLNRPDASAFTEDFRRRIAMDTRFKGGRHLRDYQNVGYTWLLWCWANNKGCILGDEMGLGKTVQVVAFINFLVQRYYRSGPYLIIAPLSTIPHWEREIQAWTDLNCVVFHGSEKARDMIIKHEFFFNTHHAKQHGQYKFNVLLTTFEIVMREFERLGGINYEAVIVDEGHKLKNKDSAMFKTLSTLRSDYRMMMTGTPVQNNTVELWTLLAFLNPYWEWSEENFVARFGDLQTPEQLAELHAVIRPYILRRTKEDVMKELPPKVETLIKVRLTSFQKMNYKAVIEGNREYLSGGKGKLMPSLSNVMMQLRKVCNHPYLLPGAEERAVTPLMTREERYEQLIQSSSKLILLDKLLRKLKEGDHKVLIFSQMTKALDLLEDYLRFREYKYERIDGCVGGQKRQQSIDRFQDDRYERFVFLLSTKAGGVGINLTKADTCIIYDSDWNPQNDLQAQARCHRIGQDKSVVVYRLLTENTYEEKMWEVASKKLGLDQAVLAGGGQEQNKPMFTAEQMNLLLRHGAYELYKDSGGREDDKALLEEDIDQILQRSTKIDLDAIGKSGESPTTAIAGLAGFSTAIFAGTEENGPDLNDENFWEKILPEAVTAVKLKAKLDANPRMDPGACQHFMTDLRSLVEFHLHAEEGPQGWAQTTENFQEKETLDKLLHQVQKHVSFNQQDKRKVARWLAFLDRPRKRGAAIAAGKCLTQSDDEEEEKQPNKHVGNDEGDWRCPRCTLENAVDKDICGACGARRLKVQLNTSEKSSHSTAKAKAKTSKKAEPPAASKKGKQQAPAKAKKSKSKSKKSDSEEDSEVSPVRKTHPPKRSTRTAPKQEEYSGDSDQPPPKKKPKSKQAAPKKAATRPPKSKAKRLPSPESGEEEEEEEEEVLMARKRRLTKGSQKPNKKAPSSVKHNNELLYDEEDDFMAETKSSGHRSHNGTSAAVSYKVDREQDADYYRMSNDELSS